MPVERIRTLIADDEKPARTRLRELLPREPHIEIIGEARDGREAVELIRTHAPALLFLDIQMPGLDGFGVLEAIAPDPLPATVFVTAYDKYAIQAFEAHALDYLLKPYSDQRFETALKRICELLEPRHTGDLEARILSLLQNRAGAGDPSGWLEHVALKDTGRVTFLNVSDIDWIEACGVYVTLHVGAHTHLHRSSLVHLLERLDPRRFVRVHRSAIVNVSRVRELCPRSHGDYTLLLHDGTEMILSRSYRPQFEQWLKQSL